MIGNNSTGAIVIAGGSGFLGTALATHLTSSESRVIVLSRRPSTAFGPWRSVPWDARTPGEWCSVLNGAAGLVNLAGRSVDCIKTPDHQDEILRSRVEATRVLGVAMRTVAAPPPVWVQMSTAHIYGDPPEVVCSEESPLGQGFAPSVGRAWEEEFHRSVLPEQRGVVLRTSFVIGRDRGAGGGALTRLKWLVRLGLGGRVGTGTQGMSWIHESDLCGVISRALLAESMSGTYIASSPHPVSQREFMGELRHALRIPVGLPACEWMVRLGAHWLLKTDPELALYGRYVISDRLAADNFEFRFPRLREALHDLTGDSGVGRF